MLEYLADDMTCILPDGTRIDKKGVQKDLTGNLFPGMRMHVDLVVSQGSKVVVQWTATGTHEGERAGIPGANKTAEISGVWIFDFDAGKVKLLERV